MSRRRPGAAAAAALAAVAALAALAALCVSGLLAVPRSACAMMPRSETPTGLVAASADSEPSDSLGVPVPVPDVRPDSAAAARLARIGDVRLRPRFDQPRWVMLRSLAFPGWGQWHNRAHFKALAVAAVEGWMIARIVGDERALQRLLDDVNRAQQEQDAVAYELAVNSYNARFDESVSRRWLLGAAIAYAVVDAYVDAHFVDFGVQFDRDPALPGGRRSVALRLGVRRSW